MIKCKAKEISHRLHSLHIEQVIRNSDKLLFKLAGIRQMFPKIKLSDLEREKLERIVDLVALSFDMPYEIEGILLIAERDVIRDLFSSVRKSIALLKEMDDVEFECEEEDSYFYMQYALFCLGDD